MDCERADLLVGLLGAGDDPADGALTPAERVEAEAHVAACAACREALEAYRALSGALRALPPSPAEAPSPEATARAYAAVVEAMGAAATARSGGGGGVRVLDGGRAARPAKRSAWRRPGVWLQGLAAAACVLIVVNLALRADRDPDSAASVSRAPAGSPADAPEAAAPAEQKVAPPAPASPRAEADAAKQEGARGEPSGAEDQAPGQGAAADALSGRPAGSEGAPAPTLDAERLRPAETSPQSAPAHEEFARRAQGGRAAPEPSADAAAEAPAPQAPPAPPAPPVPPSAAPAPGGPARGRALPADEELAAAAEQRDDDAADAGMNADGDGAAGGGGGSVDGGGGEPAVVAAWRVGDRLLVLERVGDRVTAREGELRAEARVGALAEPSEDPQVATARQARVDVTPVPPSWVAPQARLADGVSREGAGALERELRWILAAELGRARDAGWRTRVAAALMALGERPADAASAADLADHAARVLSGQEPAPSGR